MSVRMKVVQGKPHGSYLEFPEGEFVVGRGPECHVRPNSELISRQHCLLRIRGAVLVVRDLGSTNGTLVNGKRLMDECALGDGDTIQLGPLVLQVVVEADGADVPPAVAHASRYTLPPETGSAETHEFSAVAETDLHPIHNLP
jgi:pSer/pThr/pTyr-binding forkhead associated (FHA) protein